MDFMEAVWHLTEVGSSTIICLKGADKKEIDKFIWTREKVEIKNTFAWTAIGKGLGS